MQWASDGEYAFSASADKTAAMWDARTGARVRQYKGHADIVNSFCPSRDVTTCASASDDRSARLWDSRVRLCQRTVSHPWQVTAVSMGHDGKRLFTGSLDGHVRLYDLRRYAPTAPCTRAELASSEARRAKVEGRGTRDDGARGEGARDDGARDEDRGRHRPRYCPRGVLRGALVARPPQTTLLRSLTD